MPMSYEPEGGSFGRSRAAEKTSLPGIFLIIVGALSLPWNGYWIFQGIMAGRAEVTDEVMKKMEEDPAQKKNLEEMKKLGWTPEGVVKTMGGAIIGVGA